MALNNDYSRFRFLGKVNSSRELKKLDLRDLAKLCEEARERIIEVVSENGGHLSSNLGAVELTVALHYVFNTPHDKIVWDVGHQTYTHKLLTGRANRFHTIRQAGGLSGFPKREESEYDVFDVGHSSTSISAAVGFCEARDLRDEHHKVIAVIGDGSMTAGVAFEGLDQAGHLHKDLIIVLNDNEMSISKNTGALAKYLNSIITGSLYNTVKERVYNFAKSLPDMGEPAIKLSRRVEESLKNLFVPGVLFEDLGIKYVGPVDGNDLHALIDTFRRIKGWRFPVLVHTVTKKGKGFLPSELRPATFHSAPKFDISTGEPKSPAGRSYTSVFGDAMVKLAKEDEHIIAITAAMPQGTGLDRFQARFPERFYDVGIAEQHAIVFAGVLGISGFKPVAAIYSTFMQRAFDQVFQDVCLQNADVVLALDRAGIVGNDGPTHNGLFDLSFLRSLPNMVIMAPKDENELQHMLKTAIATKGPVAVRYPRGQGIGAALDEELRVLEIGKAELLKDGSDVAILAIGAMVHPALEAATVLSEQDGIDAAVINARFAHPIDADMLLEWARKTGHIVTVEENALAGGFGSAVLETLVDNGMFNVPVKRIGIGDFFLEHGSTPALRAKLGLDAQGIAKTTAEFLNSALRESKKAASG